MDKEEFADLLALVRKGAACEGGHDGSVYAEDAGILRKFGVWLVESEIMTEEEARQA